MALTYLDTLSEVFSDMALPLSQCGDFYRRKLYHQLTDQIEEMLANNINRNFDWIEFEEKFIRDFRSHMNPLRYANIVVSISLFAKTSAQGVGVVKQAIQAIEDPSAKLVLQCQLAHFHLVDNDRTAAKETLEEVENGIKKNIGIAPPELLARYHQICAELWKDTEEVGKFYRNAMSYLGYETKDVSKPEVWANDIALAALADKSFYDFGELSLHPIMSQLKNTQREWVLAVVQAFIRGELEYFNSVMQKYEKEINSDAILRKYVSVMNEKIRLLSLVRLAFYKESIEKVLTFKEISALADTDIIKVEQLVMRAMSVGLLKGVVDGIEETVTVHYVKPRILDRDEIAAMHKRSEKWVDNIEKVKTKLEGLTKEIESGVVVTNVPSQPEADQELS